MDDLVGFLNVRDVGEVWIARELAFLVHYAPREQRSRFAIFHEACRAADVGAGRLRIDRKLAALEAEQRFGPPDNAENVLHVQVQQTEGENGC